MPSPYLPLADLARTYGVTPRTARRWARADNWRRKGTRPVRWSLADAQRSYEARRNRVQRHLTAKYAPREDDNHGQHADNVPDGRT